MEQLSVFDISTNIEDYLADITQRDITISKKLSKSINSKGFYIVMHENKKLCYVGIKKIDDFVGLEVRHSDDRTGAYIPCSPQEISGLLNEAFQEYIKLKGGVEE